MIRLIYFPLVFQGGGRGKKKLRALFRGRRLELSELISARWRRLAAPLPQPPQLRLRLVHASRPLISRLRHRPLSLFSFPLRLPGRRSWSGGFMNRNINPSGWKRPGEEKKEVISKLRNNNLSNPVRKREEKNVKKHPKNSPPTPSSSFGGKDFSNFSSHFPTKSQESWEYLGSEAVLPDVSRKFCDALRKPAIKLSDK